MEGGFWILKKARDLIGRDWGGCKKFKQKWRLEIFMWEWWVVVSRDTPACRLQPSEGGVSENRFGLGR